MTIPAVSSLAEESVRMREYAVHPALAPYVKCIWSLESDAPICDAGRERILPDSCVELVFHFRDTYRSHFAGGESSLQPASFVVGQMRRFLEIEPTGRAGLIAVRFYARGAYLFFDRPLHEVAAGVVDLQDLWRAPRQGMDRADRARGRHAGACSSSSRRCCPCCGRNSGPTRPSTALFSSSTHAVGWSASTTSPERSA